MSDIFSDPQIWPVAHRHRTGPPPSDEEGLLDWIHWQYVPTRYNSEIQPRLDWVRRNHRAGSARALLVSGVSDTGKTSALMSMAIRDAMTSERGWYARDPKTGLLYVPWVYVLATTKSSSASILQSVARFCGIEPSGNEAALRSRLSATLPRLGTKAIIVDEAHALRRSSAAARSLPDGVRGLSHMRTPFIFAGIELESSAICRDFGISDDSVTQITKRKDFVKLEHFPTGNGTSELLSLIARYAKRLEAIPGFTTDGVQHPEVMQALISTAGRLPGLMFEILKDAATDALAHDRHLTPERIQAAIDIRDEQRASA